jgi:hypothetical protein
MQSFLPLPDFVESARVLDNKRLGKQRVECKQILKALNDPNYGWQNHPAVKMWRGYETALEAYMNVCITEWVKRVFKNNMPLCTYGNTYPLGLVFPDWFCDSRFHAARCAALLFKDYNWYSRFGWKEEPELNYWWPK